eukprot:Awhi_evm1s2284
MSSAREPYTVKSSHRNKIASIILERTKSLKETLYIELQTNFTMDTKTSKSTFLKVDEDNTAATLLIMPPFLKKLLTKLGHFPHGTAAL